MPSEVKQIHGIPVDVIDGILNMSYLEEDYAKGEGLIEVLYQIRNNFSTTEHARNTVALILSAHKRLLEGNYEIIPVHKQR